MKPTRSIGTSSHLKWHMIVQRTVDHLLTKLFTLKCMMTSPNRSTLVSRLCATFKQGLHAAIGQTVPALQLLQYVRNLMRDSGKVKALVSKVVLCSHTDF